MHILKSDYFRLTLISAIFFASTYSFSQTASPQFVSRNLLLIVPFFYLISIISVVLHNRMNKLEGPRTKLYYLILSAIKMVVYIALLSVYGFIFRDDVIPFFISFLLFYLIYTLLEVRSAMKVFTR
jgi:hypothetical protein